MMQTAGKGPGMLWPGVTAACAGQGTSEAGRVVGVFWAADQSVDTVGATVAQAAGASGQVPLSGREN